MRTIAKHMLMFTARALAVSASVMVTIAAHAQVSVSPSGQPTYSVPITVPPGIAGMAPQLSLFFAGSGVNGPEGYGWSLQGISSITRCPGTVALDGASSTVAYGPNDRLCLDGQRLIRTNPTGAPQPSTTDGLGLTTGSVEYRTERDSFSRIRAYGSTGNVNDGPLYFKVWTKAGQIFEYGQSQTPDTRKARIPAQGKTATMVWAVARVSDSLGNYMDFQYDWNTVNFGSGSVAGTPNPGMEWNISEIRYTGTATRAPYNKVVFEYQDKSQISVGGLPIDSAEAYQAGSKNVSTKRLYRIRSFVGTSLAQPVLVRSVIMTYENGGTDGVTGRSRLSKISECFGESTTTPGAAGTKCTQATVFTYANTGDESLTLETAFNLGTLNMIDPTGSYGVLVGDFNGDGRADLIRWTSLNNDGTLVTKNRLFTSDGDGSFTEQTLFFFPDKLFTADGCFYSIVMDMDADGLPDIVRLAGANKLNGDSCTITTGESHIFHNNGNNSFSPTKITSNGTAAILLERYTSRPLSQQFCGPTPFAPGQFAPQACSTGYGWTAGANFYIGDVNGDGRPDIIKTKLPLRQPRNPNEFETQGVCESQCTFVYLGTATFGTYSLVATNIPNQTLYSDPGAVGEMNWPKHIGDIDGDGLADIIGVGKSDNSSPVSKYGAWRAIGSTVSPLPASVTFEYVLADACDYPIDFNGDGRRDCLQPSFTATFNTLAVSQGTLTSNVADFNIKATALKSADTAPSGSAFGSIIADFNADGRQDILRWHDSPALNALFLSYGDGKFKTVQTGYTTTAFKKGDGAFDSIFADFTGKGVGDILRISRSASTSTATDYANTNNLYVRSTPQTPDRLLTVTSPTKLVTTLVYATTANAPSGHYASDRGNATNAAAYPDIDVGGALPIVITSTSDTGVGTGTTNTEYAYRGLKADAKGRGLLGFRETRVQRVAPDGTATTTATEYLQDRPYEGVASWTETRRANLSGYDAAGTLSRTTNIYCDTTSATLPASATVSTPCASTAKVTQPYLYLTKETGFDIDASATALPTVTTTNSVDVDGNTLEVKVVTTGTFEGARTYTKTTVNEYLPAAKGGDYWILGRLSTATVTSTVPNVNPPADVGYAPYGNWTDGGGVTQTGSAAASKTKPVAQGKKESRAKTPSTPANGVAR